MRLTTTKHSGGGRGFGGFVAAYLPGPLAAIVLQLSRYTIVSGLALCLDFLVFMALLKTGLHPSFAGAVGYSAGLVLAYVLLVRYVFDGAATGKTQVRLIGEFIASGLIGILITALIIAVATDLVGVRPVIGKLAAVGVSFIAVYLLRRTVVFSQSAPLIKLATAILRSRDNRS